MKTDQNILFFGPTSVGKTKIIKNELRSIVAVPENKKSAIEV